MTINAIQVCVITGATSGIGKATAIQLAKLNLELVLIGRNSTKLEYTKQVITKKNRKREYSFIFSWFIIIFLNSIIYQIITGGYFIWNTL